MAIRLDKAFGGGAYTWYRLQAAYDFACEIAGSAPLAVESIRYTMRGHLADAIKAATDNEKAEQDRLRTTNDWREGVNAMNERRTPNFTRS